MGTENDQTLNDQTPEDVAGNEVSGGASVDPLHLHLFAPMPDLTAAVGRSTFLGSHLPDLTRLVAGHTGFAEIQRIASGWTGSSGVLKALAATTSADKLSKQLEFARGTTRSVYDTMVSAHLDAMGRDMARSATLAREIERSAAAQRRLEVASSFQLAYAKTTAASDHARSMMRDMERGTAAAREFQRAYEVKNLAIQNFASAEAARGANRLVASLAADWRMPRLDLPNMPLFKVPDLNFLSGSANILADWHDAIERGDRAFGDSEYSFLEEFITGDFAIYLGRLDPAQRQAELADCMWRLTRSRAFRTILRRVFACHPDLNTRWTAISEGLSSHRRGHHHAAVRTILPEIEGLLTQLLLARGEAIMHGGKPHAVGPDGNVLRNRRGDVVKLGGLGEKLVRCRPTDDPALQIVADRFLRQLPPDRNRTLHGEDGAAGNREFSTRLVCGLYVLVYVSAIELHARGALVRVVSMAEARSQAERTLDKARIFLPSDVFQAS